MDFFDFNLKRRVVVRFCLFAVLIALSACGGGKDGRDGEVGPSGPKGDDGLTIVSTTFCQLTEDMNPGVRVLHVEWTEFSDDSRYIKCLASWSPGSAYDINTNSNMRSSTDEYKDQCLLPYGIEDYFQFHIDSIDHSAYVHAYFPYSDTYWTEDLDCETL